MGDDFGGEMPPIGRGWFSGPWGGETHQEVKIALAKRETLAPAPP